MKSNERVMKIIEYKLDKLVIEYKNNGKLINHTITNAKGIKCILSDNGKYCPIEYREESEYIPVVLNNELLQCNDIWERDPLNDGYCYTRFGAVMKRDTDYINSCGVVSHRKGHMICQGKKNDGYYTLKIGTGKDRCTVYIHNYLMECVSGVKIDWRGDDKSVDHIDRNKWNNMVDNLRISNRSEQNKNKGKMKRINNNIIERIYCIQPDGTSIIFNNRKELYTYLESNNQNIKKESMISCVNISLRNNFDLSMQYSYLGYRFYWFDVLFSEELKSGEYFVKYRTFEVSNLGRVRKWDKNHWKYYTGSKNNSGYLIIKINDTNELLHRVVCKAFYGEPVGDKKFACHRNNDKNDNRVENLYWGTEEENQKDNAILYEKKVICLNKDLTFVKIYKSMSDIRRELNKSVADISLMCNNKPRHCSDGYWQIKSAYGFVWCFLTDYITGLLSGKYPIAEDLSPLEDYVSEEVMIKLKGNH